jgi:hypothetical protein
MAASFGSATPYNGVPGNAACNWVREMGQGGGNIAIIYINLMPDV